MYAKAIYVDGRIVTGRHHGEAYGLLSDEEKCSDTLLSGFYDENTGRFQCDDSTFYAKSVYLIRHSRPCAGYDETIDPGLSQEGIDKAHLLAVFLKKEGVDFYEGYTSPFLRCLTTADIISRLTGIQFTVDPDLTEFVEDDTLLENHALNFPQFTWPTLDGFRFEKEDATSYDTRIKAVAEQLPTQSVVVSHYTPITCLTKLVSGSQDTTPVLPMASYTYINNNKIVYFGKQV